jgi:hypothetical protein
MAIFLPLNVRPGTPILRGFDFLWQRIREAGRRGREFTISELDLASNDPHRRSAADYVKRLEKAGIVEATGWRETTASERNKGMSPVRTYRLLCRPTETPHLKRDGSEATGTGRAPQMWNAIRALQTFTSKELAIAASTEERPVSVTGASAYANALVGAGYLLVIEPGRGRRGPFTFRLKPSGNTGPKAPLLLSARVVYDQNRKAIAGQVVAAEIAT